MAYVRFHPRPSELFPNSRINSQDFLELTQQALQKDPDKIVLNLKSFPDQPVIKLDKNNYLIIDMKSHLGEGAVGSVYLCRHLLLRDGKLCLLPSDPKSPYGAVKLGVPHPEIELDEKTLAASYEQETKRLATVGYSAEQKPLHFQFMDKPCFLIPMRLIRGKCLADEIALAKGRMRNIDIEIGTKVILMQHNKQKILQVFDGLLKMIQHLHSEKMAHLDIQAKNVILQTIIPDHRDSKHEHVRFIPHLVDFQLSSRINTQGYATMKSFENKDDASEFYQDFLEDEDDQHSIKLSDTAVLVHQNSDFYNAAKIINEWLYELNLETHDPIFYKSIRKITQELQEKKPEDRNIDKARLLLVELAEKMHVELISITNPFRLQYTPPTVTQFETPLSSTVVKNLEPP